MNDADIIFPTITWEQGDDCWSGSTPCGFNIQIYYQWSGPSAGFWNVLVNGRTLTTGHGPYGYDFSSRKDAQTDAMLEVKLQVMAKVREAQKVLEMYTK